MIFFTKWWQEREKKAFLRQEAERGAKTLNIMLQERPWYGGIRVVDKPQIQIEVLIVDEFPGIISAYIPPQIGVVPVYVRFGKPAQA